MFIIEKTLRSMNNKEGMVQHSFLQGFINSLIRDFSGDLQNTTVVFQNRRAGLFFKDKFAKSVGHTKQIPQVLTLEELAMRLSKLVLADKLTLVYKLYEVFRRHDTNVESFDRFYFWGELLLADFSELDMSLVNAKDLFTNLKDLKTIDAAYDYLSDEQKKIIARFWESFRYDEQQNAVISSQAQFLTFWNKLYPVYKQFRSELSAKGLAYEGLIYRHIVDALTYDKHILPEGQFIFVGLNALKNAELQIVQQLISAGKAKAYWDVDQYDLDNEVKESGMFLRKYLRSKTLSSTFQEAIPDHFHSGIKRQIHLHGVSLEVGQAKKVGEYLWELSQQADFDPERCVIVLPEEHMLFPILHSLPTAIQKVNVTMGYPLRNTSLYSFIEHVLNLQLEKKKAENQKFKYHFETLLALLRHPYIKIYQPAEADHNIQNIVKRNAVYLNLEDLGGERSFYQKLLQPVEDVPTLFTYLQYCCAHVHLMLQSEPIDDKQEEHTVNSPEVKTDAQSSVNEAPDSGVNLVEKELLYHFYIHLNRLKSLTEEQQFDFELTAFIKLLRQVFQSLRVPFSGEPLRGLQIMGLLETRNLDFDHVFMLSMNEGIMPASESNTSFIPANLKKGFGLFGVDQQDAFYAKAFFRLLHRAQHVHLFYNTEDTSQLKGEMSRFLNQIYYESVKSPEGELRFPDEKGDFVVNRDFLSMNISPAPIQKISIQKTDKVWEQLSAYRKNGLDTRQAMLTPSAINTYLDCRLKFYYQYIAQLRETEEVEDEMDARVFGNILHKTMEVLYKDFIALKGSAIIEAEECLQLKTARLDEAIHKGFIEHYQQEKAQGFNFEGRNIIAREIVKKMAKQILNLDSQYAPFEIVSLEVRGDEGYYADLEIEANQERLCIALKGIIDRVDRKEKIVRVLDYKTGRDERKISDIHSLFDREHSRRNKAGMQALFYAWLYQVNQEAQDETIIPGLVNATELFRDNFDPSLILGNETIADFTSYQEEFILGLKKILEELFDKKTPFDQTQDEKKCSFCPYANICY